MSTAVDLLALAPRDLLRELTRRHAPARGASLLVAVSGGADSTALAHLLARAAPSRGWDLTLACLDHGLRGDEGAEDVLFVGRLAGRLGLPFYSDRLEGRRVPGRSPEESARIDRRRFLLATARAVEASVIAVAHTADDQAETVLFRLGRGSGMRGLGGMSRWSDPFWRPLLRVRRARLRELLVRAGLEWRDDPTNDLPIATRNKVRHQLLPALEQALGHSAIDAVGRAARLMRDDERYLELLAHDEALSLTLRDDGGRIELDRRKLASLPPALSRRVVLDALGRLAGGKRRISAAHVLGVLSLATAATAGTHLDLPEQVIAERHGRRLVLVARDGRDAEPSP